MEPLRGRTEELSRLSALLDADPPTATNPATTAADPAPAPWAALIGGDAGMGKTRLLLELTTQARSAGWRVLVGHCLDLADQLLPYLPFSELVGRFADDEPELVASVAALDPVQHPALAALAPRRRLLSGDRPGDRADDLPRTAVLDGVSDFLETLAGHGPVLVLLEDLHWADQSTRDLLSYLLSRPPRGPVRLVASYRTDDLHRRHPLRASLAGWSRLPGVQRITLGPLPDTDMGALVRGLGPTESLAGLPERQVAEIVARAGGNAFFAEELVGESPVRRRRRRTDTPGRRAAAASGPARRGRPDGRPGRRLRWPAGLPPAARGRRRLDARGPRRGPAGRRRQQCAGAPAARTASASATRCWPRRSTTTCCRASGCASTAGTSTCCAPASWRARPPSWPPTPAPRTTSRPRCAPVCRRARKPWRSAAPTTRSATSPQPWSSRPGPAADPGTGRSTSSDSSVAPPRPSLPPVSPAAPGPSRVTTSTARRPTRGSPIGWASSSPTRRPRCSPMPGTHPPTRPARPLHCWATGPPASGPAP